MSYMAFHGDADKALLGKFWGTKIPDKNEVLKDTGVQEFAEELLRILTSVGPIQLERPLEFINPTNGPAIKIYNTGDVDWMGIRLRDKAGNEAQFGIGLGNEGLTANNFVPHPKFSTDPNDNHRFYSETGGNANTDREHPKAVEANNGLIGYEYLINNFTVPYLNFFQKPEYHEDDCASYYTWSLFGESVILPTYVPQPMIRLGVVINANIDKGDTGTVSEVSGPKGSETMLSPAVEWTVYNRQFDCVEVGDVVAFSCIDGAQEILSAPEKSFFKRGTTAQAIAQGDTGNVTSGEETIVAINPFDTLTCNVEVAIARDTSNGCGSWVIISAECWDVDRCV